MAASVHAAMAELRCGRDDLACKAESIYRLAPSREKLQAPEVESRGQDENENLRAAAPGRMGGF